MPNQTSTRFIQEAWVGVKCTTNRGFVASHVAHVLVLVGGVVVHHQVQLDRVAVLVEDVTVGPFDLLEERQELLVAVPAASARR